MGIFGFGARQSIGPVLRARVPSPRPLSTRSGEDELYLKYSLAVSHPEYAAMALADPRSMDTMHSEYLRAVAPDGFDEPYPECWWNVGHLEQ